MLCTMKCEHLDLGLECVFPRKAGDLAVGGGFHGVVLGLSELAGLFHHDPPALFRRVPQIPGFSDQPKDFALFGPVVWRVSTFIALPPERVPLIIACVGAPVFSIEEALVVWACWILEVNSIRTEPCIIEIFAVFTPPLVALFHGGLPFRTALVVIVPHEAMVAWPINHGVWLLGGVLGDGGDHALFQAILGGSSGFLHGLDKRLHLLVSLLQVEQPVFVLTVPDGPGCIEILKHVAVIGPQVCGASWVFHVALRPE